MTIVNKQYVMKKADINKWKRKKGLPELCEGTTTSSVMQSPGCTTWVRDQTRAVFGISFDALTATITFSAPSEPFSCFPRFCCSRLISTNNPTKISLLNGYHSITLTRTCSYILNNEEEKHKDMFKITSFLSPCQAPTSFIYNQHATRLQALTEQPLTRLF